MNLSTKIGEFSFENCVMNASGPKCTSERELLDLIQGPNASYVTKSVTLHKREGNPKPRYADISKGSINSMGLPNEGLDFYLHFLEKHQQDKTAFLSVAGLSLEENLQMLEKIENSSFNGLLELNLSCPNVPGKPQTGYDFERTKQVLQEVFKIYNKTIGVKLPPYFDMIHFKQMAEILNQFPLSFVTCINSIGNGLSIDLVSETVLIKPKDGFGGIGGAYIKPTALANVRKFYTLLNDSISIIGCGGIQNGKDIFEHILCGASMVQIGTEFMKEGMPIYDRVLKELEVIMLEKGYTSIDDFKGKLKSI